MFIVIGILFFAPSNWEAWRVNVVGIVLAICGGLSFFFLAGGISVGLRQRFGKVASIAVRGTGGVGFAVLILVLWFQNIDPFRAYRITLRVQDEQGKWLDDVEVKASINAYIKKAGYLWEIEVPLANRPQDGHVSFSASNPEEFLYGEAAVVLDTDPTPTVTLTVKRDRSAYAIGNVVDQGGSPISDALVYVQGFEHEAVRTGRLGEFKIPAHAGPGEVIRINAEKSGYGPESVVAHAERFISITLLRSNGR